MGGPTKIDSVQNLITLRRDLQDAWENHEFGVDPNVSPISAGIYLNLKCSIMNRTTTALLPLPMAIKT